ncbi:hypothetical protein DPEC_G00063030 [Dallia pectoralis]|uniref:Uncharacterized protein n=1 Tax=Dallia pectoralis TaxID=75939 RepID=A0ACC2H7A7_DALPE|nr:hypothetical protein DPEC_G00063030 [Dallia pectoralis]
MLVLRLLFLLFSGYPLFRDEQDRFVCNTIQPGCTNVCFDRFAPVSLFRFWLFQLIALCLPHIMFIAYIIHKVSSVLHVFGSGSRAGPVFAQSPQALPKRPPTFFSAYLLDLVVRILLEAAFGAGQYFLYGFSVPRSFQCYDSPCTSMVECYVAKPTEKTIMLNLMLGAASLSLLLNLFDLVWSVQRVVTRGRRSEDPGGDLKNEGGLFANGRVGGDTEVLYNHNHSTPKTVLKRGPSHSGKPSSNCYPNGNISHGRVRINNDTNSKLGTTNLLGSRPPWRDANTDQTAPFQPMPTGAPSSGRFDHPKNVARTTLLPVSRRIEREPTVLSRLSTPSPLYSSQRHRRHTLVDTTLLEQHYDSAESRDRLQEEMNMQEVGVRGSSSSTSDSSTSSDPE